MDAKNHVVTLPMDDYNQLLRANVEADKKIEKNRSEMEKLHQRSREFVSALAFLEEKGLLADFNKKINKSYALEKVGINSEWNRLVNDGQ
jgi:hypothetical protein